MSLSAPGLKFTVVFTRSTPDLQQTQVQQVLGKLLPVQGLPPTQVQCGLSGSGTAAADHWPIQAQPHQQTYKEPLVSIDPASSHWCLLGEEDNQLMSHEPSLRESTEGCHSLLPI